MHLLSDGGDMGRSHLTHISMGINTDNRRVELFAIPGKPILHVATLIRIENQYIRSWNAVDSLVDFAQWGDTS